MDSNKLNYILGDVIYSSSKTKVFKGKKKSDNTDVIIKVLNKDYPTPEEIANFDMEYMIYNQYKIDGVPKVFEKFTYNGKHAFSMEYFGGISIDNILRTRKLSLKEFLNLAIKVVQNLTEIHSHNIIHKDMNNSNIVWNEKDDIVKIIDFGISNILSKEIIEVTNPNVLEGTLPFISPEQTGRINRSIDYRSDYYSLGISFYQILTQKLPFESTDPLEVIHLHMAMKPISPDQVNKEIPPALSKIILKLLEKNAEDRYQSGISLRNDLKKCLENIENGNTNIDFEIASFDRSSRFEISQKLYGRDVEIKALLDKFSEINNNGSTEIIMVSGSSGIGKSILVHEIYKPITEKRGYFISGKFDQMGKNVPYAPVIQAIKEFTKIILTENKDQLQKWKEKILKAVGSHGQVLINIIPQIELIIGSQLPDEELPPTQSQNRLNLIFQNFIKILSSKDAPLVIFFDDLQWTDSATLNMIEILISDSEIKYLYLIGAYRENEVYIGHPLMIKLEEITKNYAKEISTIHLTAIKENDILSMLCDSLRCYPENVAALAVLVMKKTQGNPFFVNQFIKSLAKENLIYFDVRTEEWNWDIKKIEEMEFTDNVVDFLVGKLYKLSKEAQEIIKIAACFGNTFELNNLSLLFEKDEKYLYENLWKVFEEEFIVPVDKNYKYILNLHKENKIEIVCKFLHDKIQQAALAMLDEINKKKIHVKIARMIIKNTPKESIENKLFDIVNHYSEGLDLIEDESEKHQFIEMSLKAAKKARNSSAYDIAYQYVKYCLKLLRSDSWEIKYELTVDIYNEALEDAYLSNNFSEMEKLTEIALKNVKTNFEKVIINEINSRALISKGLRDDAINISIEALKLLGVKLPKTPSMLQILFGLISTKLRLLTKTEKDILNIPTMIDKYKIVAMRILYNLMSSTCIARPLLLPFVGFEIIRLSLKYGNNYYSTFGYAVYSTIIYSLEDIKSGLKLEKIHKALFKKYYQKSTEATYIFFFGNFLAFYNNHLKNVLSHIFQGYTSGLESGDNEYAAWCIYMKNYNAFYLGLNLKEMEEFSKTSLVAVKKLHQEPIVILNNLFLQTFLNLMGKSKYTIELIGEVFNENTVLELLISLNSRSTICVLYSVKQGLSYIFNNLDEAFINTNKCKEYLDAVPSTPSIPDYYFFNSMILLGLYNNKNTKQKKRIMRLVLKNQKKLKKRMIYGPMNVSHNYYLVEAEIARVRNDHVAAMKLYEQAISEAKQNEYLNHEALANEVTGRYYISRNMGNIAKSFIIDAWYAYQKWGAEAKTRQLEKKYPHFFSDILKQNPIGINRTSTISIDLMSIIKSSQAIFSEIEYSKLIDKLMKVIAENSGAQKVVLLTKKVDEFLPEAIYNVSSNTIQMIDLFAKENIAKETVYPDSIICYVGKMQEIVITDNAANDVKYNFDEYIKKNSIKSVCCIPLIYKGNLNRILYIENNYTIGAFTTDRVELLKVLSSQMIISLENALAYTHLKELVHGKTEQLEASDSDKNTSLESFEFEDLIKMNKDLENKITDQTNELKDKNKHIMDSINYAKLIQLSILPRVELFQKNLKEHFILWQPRDIVGGDIYWFSQFGDNFFIGVIDCTGHGVPGAFMTMTANSVLSRVTGEICNDDPAKILQELNKYVRITLNHHLDIADTNEYEMLSDDGMDVALCFVMPKEKRLIYSGAKIPLYMCQNDKLTVINGDKKGIGYRTTKEDFKYTNHEVSLTGSEMFYLTTDGFIDQHSIEKRFGMGPKVFGEMLVKNYKNPIYEQQEKLETALNSYKGSAPQTDDITVIGFRPFI